MSGLFLLLLLCVSGVFSSTFTMTNSCGHTIWPGILANTGTSPLDTTGFALQKDESRKLSVPTSWSGRIWARTACTQDSTGKFSCLTADCGSGMLECAGGGAAPPATLAEFTLNGANGLDFYDVSLVDGYNLPMLVVPQGGGSGGNCSTTGCVIELNAICPTELKVAGSNTDTIACKSACEAFGEAQYCCSGEFGNPNTCKPSSYSQFFKTACPRAYSYAYDDGTSTFTCASADYVITFCPSVPTSKKASQNPEAADLPLYNSSMIFSSGEDYNSSGDGIKVAYIQLVPTAITIMATMWNLFFYVTLSVRIC